MDRFLIIILLLGSTAAGCHKEVMPVVPEPPPGKITQAPAAITPTESRVAVEPVVAPNIETAAVSEIIVDAPQPVTFEPPGIFEEAEQNFSVGNYKQAAQDFEKFLYAFPKAADRDRALFHFGFSLALSGGDQDLLQTEAALRRLIAEFPKSPYRRQAEWILDLKTRIEQLQFNVKERDERIRQLSEELRKLKSIDFDRRPSRPE